MARKKQTDRDYPETYLTCRDLRHAWDVLGYFKHSGLIRRRLQCARCLTERVDTWRPSTGTRAKNGRYVYPDGYKVAGGLDNSQVRKDVLSKAKVFDSQEAMIAAVFSG